MSGDGTIKIFAGSASKEFAAQMCDYLGSPMGKCTTHIFSEGNTFVRIDESIRDKDVYFVQTLGLDPNNEFTELLFFLDAFKRASANSVTAIIPYFSYAKGDKKDEPRVSIRGRVCAECIELAGADRVVTMDLHAAQVQGFFKKPVDHLYAQDLLCAYARYLGIVDDNLVVVSPDAGSAKRARMMANELGCAVAIGDKTRTGHDENAKVLEIIGDKIKILSAAPMFAEAVRHIHDRMSMSNLFDNPSQRMLTMSFAKQMSLDDMMNLHK